MTTSPHEHMTETDPAKQGEANKRKALGWVYMWGYSTAPLIQLLLRHQGMSWTTGAVKNGWLRKTGMTARERVKVLTLTGQGLAWVEERADKLFKYSELEPHRISPQKIWHNLFAQRMTILAGRAGEAVACMTERQLAAKSVRGDKQPDALWIDKEQNRIGVEIELTAKWDQRFDEFVSSIIAALSPDGEGRPARFQKFIVITTSKAIATRYEAGFQPGARVRVWRTAARSGPMVDHVIEVPEWVSSRVEFRVVKENGEAIEA